MRNSGFLCSIALASAAAYACTGSLSDGWGTGASVGAPPPTDSSAQVPLTGARRLTRGEYDATLAELVGDDTRGGVAKLPEDVSDPFDNDYTTQQPSAALVAAAETLARDAAQRLVADPAKRAKVVPCTPSGPGDTKCLRTFISAFGRRALRRPLASDEIDRYAGLGALSMTTGDFYTGVELVVRAMLQDLEFLYRIEIGAPVADRPGLAKLSDYEVATRLSYLFLGTTPSEELLGLADRGALSTPAGVRSAAERLLADPRARTSVERFHALWLGYAKLPHPAELSAAMRAETNALLDRVVFEKKGDYFDIFRATETFVNAELAQSYGLPAPSASAGAWVAYGSTGRKGVLSHGAILSAFSKFADTSPTQRGLFIRTRLLCGTVPKPPSKVVADAPPAGDSPSQCKADKYKAHATGGCAGCHKQMDPIGFGLENYDKAGRFREHDDGKPECIISGQGEVDGVGTFKGPSELADVLLASGELESCLVRQVYRFAVGRKDDADDAGAVSALGTTFRDSGRAFDQLLLDIAASEWFGYARKAP